MNSGNGRLSVLEEAMEELIEKKPYCGDVLKAFRPAITTRNRLVEQLELGKIEPWRPDEIKFQGGLPIIRQQALFLEDDPWKEIAAAMIPALQEGLPVLRDELERLRTHLNGGTIRLFDYFKAYTDEPEAVIGQWAALCDAQPLSIGLFLNDAARIILAIRAQEIAPLIDGLLWDKGSRSSHQRGIALRQGRRFLRSDGGKQIPPPQGSLPGPPERSLGGKRLGMGAAADRPPGKRYPGQAFHRQKRQRRAGQTDGINRPSREFQHRQ